MKVLVGPRLDPSVDPLVARVCQLLAGENGEVVSLAGRGFKNPYRRCSAAEVQTLRGALRDERGVVGYVCRGAPAPGGMAGWVVVTDHANLTWWSPLAGPNDERVGPRFPSLADAYAPEAVMALVGGEEGMIVVPGVVAGVPNDLAMTGYEADVVRRLGWAAVSSELVTPVIVAAHMGMRVAALVMTVLGRDA
jgi:hypothetical protein